MDSYLESQLKLVKNADALSLVWDYWTRGNTVMSNTYVEFKNRSLSDCITSWQTRYNGFSPTNEDLIFLNFTRNMVIGYLSNVAINRPEIKITSINKDGVINKALAEVMHDVNKATLINENGDRKFFNVAFASTVKGTGISYEGYKRCVLKDKEVIDFDPTTGDYKTEKQERVTFDDVYQEEVPVENLIIMDPYEPDIQKQPALIWRKLMDVEDFQEEFGHYDEIDQVQVGVQFGNAQTQFYGNNTNNIQLQQYQVEVLRFYHRVMNRHIIIAGGVPIYDGPLPFRHRLYPFSKVIFEPATTIFFWGIGMPDKVQGEQDSLNSNINMMDEKTLYSLKPFILSSDDDLSDQEEVQIGQIKKVTNIEKYKIHQMPGVNAGESNYFNQIQQIMKETAGVYGGASAFTKNGGKLDTRQVMLQQQEANARMSFSSSFLEDYEAERTKQRLFNIMQFYPVPRIEKYGGVNGKTFTRLIYKNVQVPAEINGQPGTKSIYFQNAPTPEEREMTYRKMERAEDVAAMTGDSVRAQMVDAAVFNDYSFDVKCTRNSSWMKNQALEQQVRLEYAQYILNFVMQASSLGTPLNVDLNKVLEYVNESFDVPFADFQSEAQQVPGQGPPGLPGMGQPSPQQMQPNMAASPA